MDREFSFKVNGVTQSSSSYITYDTKTDQIVIDTDGKYITGSGELEVEMEIKLTAYPTVTRTETFMLYAIASLYSPKDFPVEEIQYVGGITRWISFGDFYGTGIHPDEITYSVLANDSSVLPEAISYNDTNHTFTVDGNFEGNSTYMMSVIVGLEAYPDFYAPYNWTLDIIRNSTSDFDVLNLAPQIDLPMDYIN